MHITRRNFQSFVEGSLESDYPEIGYKGWKSTPLLGVSGAVLNGP